MRNNRIRFAGLVLACVFVSSAGSVEPGAAPTAKLAIDRGLQWLIAQQQPDGSWEKDVGITSLALTALARSPRKYREVDGPFVRNAVKYILDAQKPDGGIYEMHLSAYCTSVALMALASLENASYEVNIKRAQNYILGLQCDEEQGYTPDDRYYGGVGYGNDLRPDLSNLQFVLEALKESDTPQNAEVWTRAITFLQRCQNRSESNDQPWAGNDGGFVYDPGHSNQDVPSSYGSMTYAGLKSYIYAGLSRDDPRVKAAYDWILNNYSIEENPGMGQSGVFYYYHTFAKTFAVLGEKEIGLPGGETRDWGKDLTDRLMALQKPEGYWTNEQSSRWWENNKVLATCYALLALIETSRAYAS